MSFRSQLLRAAGALSVLAAFSAPTARAQVVLSEIDFATRVGVGPWIEITNRGSAPVDLSAWSIYLATKTATAPQNYWWGFPRGTSLAAGAFLRVHWMAPKQTATTTDIYTGNRVSDFLFGLWSEPLSSTSGALALMSTQSSSLVNDSNYIVDWVSWGDTGFRRENLAIKKGRWTANSQAPGASSATPPSLAYDYSQLTGRSSGQLWFRDSTPTPLRENLGGARADRYGTPCQGQLTRAVDLVAIGMPALGNRGFKLMLDRPCLTGEAPFGMFNVRGDGTLKLLGCTYWLDKNSEAFTALMPRDAQGYGQISFNGIPDSALAGATISAQWAIVEPARMAVGFTSAITLRFGR